MRRRRSRCPVPRRRDKKSRRQLQTPRARKRRDSGAPTPGYAALFPISHNGRVFDSEGKRQRRLAPQAVNQFCMRHERPFITYGDRPQPGFYLAKRMGRAWVVFFVPRLTRSDQENKEVGARLAAFREIFGLTQDEAAGAAGVKQNVWSHWENGRNLPDVRAMKRLCATFGLSLDWIYSNKMTGLPTDLLTKLLAKSR
jgi:DNA-binding XRE family transcriptional regulator